MDKRASGCLSMGVWGHYFHRHVGRMMCRVTGQGQVACPNKVDYSTD